MQKSMGGAGTIGIGKNLKNTRKLRKAGSKLKRFLFVLIMLFTVIAIFMFFTNKYFFKVQIILITDVTGNEKYSYDDILKSSGIVEGSELYGIDLNQVKYNIKKQLAYVNSVDIIRIPPSTVSIEVKTDKGMFGIKLGGDYYIISDNFRVIDKIDIISGESGFVPPGGIITFSTGAVKKCFVGEQIEFSDDDIADFLREITALFKDSDISKMMDSVNLSITSVNVSDKFNVVMNYSDRFLVKFGIFENISSKIWSSLEIINQLHDDYKGIIDITDEKVASFSFEENITKNKLYCGIIT